MKHIIDEQLGVRLWIIEAPSGDPEDQVYYVDDPTRTPEDWSFWKKYEAQQKFLERVSAAKLDSY